MIIFILDSVLVSDLLYAYKQKCKDILSPGGIAYFGIGHFSVPRIWYDSNNNNYKTSIRQYPGKESSSMAYQVQGLGKLIPGYDAKFINNDQMARKLRKDKRVLKGELSNGERYYAIWLLNMFREWIPKSRDNNWKSTSPSMCFNPGNRQVKTRWTEFSGLGW